MRDINEILKDYPSIKVQIWANGMKVIEFNVKIQKEDKLISGKMKIEMIYGLFWLHWIKIMVSGRYILKM